MTNEHDWDLFKRKLFVKSNIDLNQYKPAQMQRRITNLMYRHGVDSYMDFYALMEKNATIYKAFIDYLTINVTEFFRTPEKFSELENNVLTDLLANSPVLNIWSAGCSIGAEPYSLAMILAEKTPNTRHRILATDLDKEMLQKARTGSYSANELKNLPPARLKKYFTVENNRFKISDEIKNRVEFMQHNLLLDSFESGFDLILCRNVVIYFTEQAKDILYGKFLTALKPKGVLFVGGTEAILNFREIGFEHYYPFFYRRPAR